MVGAGYLIPQLGVQLDTLHFCYREPGYDVCSSQAAIPAPLPIPGSCSHENHRHRARNYPRHPAKCREIC